MANRNHICTRFINYVAVLILLCLSSLSFAYTGGGGQFGGSGATGDWGEQCNAGELTPDKYNFSSFGETFTGSTPEQVRSAYISALKSRYTQDYWPSELFLCTPPENGVVYCNFRNNSGYVENLGINYSTKPKVCEQCPTGQVRINGYCQTKKCPSGQSLVNGSCQTKKCPIGQTLDASGNCMRADDQCPSGSTMINGRCINNNDDDDDDDDPNDDDDAPPKDLPPFCEWASEMCKWHNEWIQWSNDYAANEEKANLDREELNRLALDSKEQLTEINSKQEAIKEAIQNQSLTLDQIKQQDKQFYDELRLWLNNFNPEQGTPSDQYPPVEFPEFCDWSVQVCNWYLDWKDWRTDYNSNNEDMKQKFEQHLQQLQEIKNQDQEHYQETKTFFERAKDFFDESLGFFDEIRQFLNQQGSEQNGDNSGEITPEEKEIPIDESQRITFVAGCPNGEQFTVSFMGSSQTMEFSYMPLCQFMSMIRPFVISIAYLIAAYIVMGLSRGSSE